MSEIDPTAIKQRCLTYHYTLYIYIYIYILYIYIYIYIYRKEMNLLAN